MKRYMVLSFVGLLAAQSTELLCAPRRGQPAAEPRGFEKLSLNPIEHAAENWVKQNLEAVADEVKLQVEGLGDTVKNRHYLRDAGKTITKSASSFMGSGLCGLLAYIFCKDKTKDDSMSALCATAAAIFSYFCFFSKK